MPRVVKAKETKGVVAPKPQATAATAAAPVKTPATPVTASASSPAAMPVKATKAVVKPAASVASVSAEPADVEEPEVGEVERKIEQRLQDMIDELKEYKAMVSGMCNNYIEQLTDAKREIRQLKRTQKKPRPVNVNGPKKPSVFEVLTGISDDMCAFLQVPPGSKMSRNDVTHRIHMYCKKNGLLQDGDQRIINADDALKAILSPLPAGEQLTYLNLQKYLKHNYLK
jgi:chromatin remodeling complex protein RSC6